MFTGQPENRITRRRNTVVNYTARHPKPAAQDTATEEQSPAITKLTPQASKNTPQVESRTTTTTTTPESKNTTVQEQKPPNTPTKAAKTKKSIEPVEAAVIVATAAAEEQPTKRVTRAQMKECNIVLEKLSPDASVESLTTGKGKRLRGDGQMKKGARKKAKTDTVKNINAEVHSLKKIIHCPYCDKPARLSLVNHIVTMHPDLEVVTSRLAPDVADALRNSKVVPIAERYQPEGRSYQTLSHICYFCNVTKSLTKVMWVGHMAKHTGYYQYKCNDCSRKFAEKNKGHICKERNNLSKIPQPQYREDVLKGYVCDLCNFVRFNQTDIEKHLRCEHESAATKQFKELIILNFPRRQKKNQAEEDEDDASDINDDEEIIVNSSAKRRRLVTQSDNADVPEKKILRSRVVNTEAFISEPKEDDGLFDKDTMKLMKDMSFSASKDGECTARSNRAKSIAERLSERFNSVQDHSAKPVEQKATKIEPLDPMTCDEGIPIIRVAACEDGPVEESSANLSNDLEIANGKCISSWKLFSHLN